MAMSTDCAYELTMYLHTEDAELGVLRSVVVAHGGGKGQPKHRASVGRINHSVVPQTCGRVVRVRLLVIPENGNV